MDASAVLDGDVSLVPGMTRRAATILRQTFAITTVRDLLEHYPHQDRYRDIGAQVPLAEAVVGEAVTLVGEIGRWQIARPRGRRMTIARALLLVDGGGRVDVPFFNQEWRARSTPAGTRVAISGTLDRFRRTLQLKNPKLVELADGEGPGATDRIVPTYPATEGLSSTRIGGFIAAVLERLPPLPDHLPACLRERHRLLDYDSALRTIHRPGSLDAVKPARARLVYDELFTLQIGLQQRRRRLEADAIGLDNGPITGGSCPPAPTTGLTDRFLSALPFEPTAAQYRAIDELAKDLARPKPMHRLLQGDVGSGKTVVALWAMLCALDHGRQAVLMAPTEVLAEQHLRTLTRLLAPLGVNVPGGLRIELLTGSTTLSRRRRLLAEVAVGDVGLLVGTHALLEDRVTFHDLGVVVVDEQHRFGVEHRTRLRDKRDDGRTPDVLVMTATPIPRSLALTVYGDLDVTVLDELPPGRQEVVTQVIAADSPRRAKLFDFIRERVTAGERGYVVTPLVEQSEALEDVAAAQEVHRHLSEEVFPDLSVGLVHGRLAGSERDAVMERFRAGEVQVLVATTVIEVGVDVPQATVMVIEDADRFGISQLHQLRGRVGRGMARSYCVLFSSLPSDEPSPRLEAVAATTDGFELAERDLALRGEGSLFDTRQSGLPDLKLARLARDGKVVAATRNDARDLVDADPELDGEPLLLDEVRRRYGDERLAELKTG